MTSATDATYMKRALKLARKGIGTTSPNPAVGCVIVRDGRIVGEGWHRKAGTPHAEVHALGMAGPAARGADVYVTLEPCCHTGKTPPCSDALIKAGVRRVVAGMSDPNPRVSGGGLAALTSAGIQVACGVLEDECRELNRAFIKQITTGLPYVTFKCAMTLDGKIATVTGDSRWISCDASRKEVHRMRARMDAVMVGVDTVITDNPELTVRHVRGRNPLRIVVDSNLRTPGGVKLMSSRLASNTIIATTETDRITHLPFLQKGATILVCEGEDGRVSLTDLMKMLGQRGVQSILLEGGSRLAGEMLRHNLIDELVIFIAPKIIGSDGFSPLSLQGLGSMEQAVKLNFINVKRSGADIIVHARPEAVCSPA
jgi:diaminohydroxyphosphoribosylaminopyrimidine deaminase / 5-amino-6-(5-phosphoribosylamino)uracil reductase